MLLFEFSLLDRFGFVFKIKYAQKYHLCFIYFKINMCRLFSATETLSHSPAHLLDIGVVLDQPPNSFKPRFSHLQTGNTNASHRTAMVFTHDT